eukprot:3346712-Rhodomonas_salina.1
MGAVCSSAGPFQCIFPRSLDTYRGESTTRASILATRRRSFSSFAGEMMSVPLTPAEVCELADEFRAHVAGADVGALADDARLQPAALQEGVLDVRRGAERLPAARGRGWLAGHPDQHVGSAVRAA